MASIKYNKLIRDKIPEIIQAAGKIAVFEELSNVNYYTKLVEKLQEETKEFVESDEIEELADLLEIICAILDCKGLNLNQLISIQEKKREINGGFAKKLLLTEVKTDE
jgi:predicted house-cleaning noncanonical NTP pyrophosphatase (MazG superfamily)